MHKPDSLIFYFSLYFHLSDHRAESLIWIDAQLANQFISKALEFRLKLIALIASI
jgi:pterin-4a-carbinolamine dehydratase